MKLKSWFVVAVVALLIAMGSLFLNSYREVFAARSSDSVTPSVVVLTASWCGTCREVVPLVSSIVNSSSRPDLKLVILDVDSADAPNRASAYGIVLAGSDLPQIYLFNKGRTVLLFSGKGYKFGQTAQAEQQIRSRLESNL